MKISPSLFMINQATATKNSCRLSKNRSFCVCFIGGNEVFFIFLLFSNLNRIQKQERFTILRESLLFLYLMPHSAACIHTNIDECASVFCLSCNFNQTARLCAADIRMTNRSNIMGFSPRSRQPAYGRAKHPRLQPYSTTSSVVTTGTGLRTVSPTGQRCSASFASFSPASLSAHFT